MVAIIEYVAATFVLQVSIEVGSVHTDEPGHKVPWEEDLAPNIKHGGKILGSSSARALTTIRSSLPGQRRGCGRRLVNNE